MKLAFAVSCIIACLVEISDAKYEIIPDRLELFEKDRMFKIIDLRIKKVSSTSKVANGKIEFLQDISDDHSLQVSFFNFDAGQYKKYFIEKNFTNLCTSFTEDDLMKGAVKDIVDHADSKIELGKCPWPKGEFNIKNYFPEDSFLPPYISMASEKWRVDAKFYKGDDFQGGFILYCLIRNDQTLMNLGR